MLLRSQALQVTCLLWGCIFKDLWGSVSVPVSTQALSKSPEIQIGRESSYARDKDALTPPPLLCLHSFMQQNDF